MPRSDCYEQLMKQSKRFSGTLSLAWSNLQRWRSLLCCAGLALLVSVLTASAETNVLITEFMASNTSTLADEDGQFSDWIEIYNAGTNTVDLNGWYLKDSASLWQFPQTNIGPNSFIIVFASNKNRRVPGRPLHT